PLLDIDIQSEISAQDEKLTQVPGEEQQKEEKPAEDASKPATEEPKEDVAGESSVAEETKPSSTPTEKPPGKHATLATPAVRHLTKELEVDIADICGTGKDGRVLKEDVQKYSASQQEDISKATPAAPPSPSQQTEDETIPLTGVRKAMFQTMTRSLAIPHFLYTDTVDFSSLTSLRRKLNATLPKSTWSSGKQDEARQKLSALPFILKAVSLALRQHPNLNAHLDTSNASKPALNVKGSHDIGIAMDTQQGLLVPVVKQVQARSILEIAVEIGRLSALARSNKLSNADLSGATITVSNIGSIGGTVVAPVIVPPQVAILGVGKSRVVPAFDTDEEGREVVVKKEEGVFSWSADHRVVDGAYVARCADTVRRLLEGAEEMVVRMR
ncbi:hypothetical protein LTS18_010961, partial [Coniosporium uncinatum]